MELKILIKGETKRRRVTQQHLSGKFNYKGGDEKLKRIIMPCCIPLRLKNMMMCAVEESKWVSQCNTEHDL